MQVLKRFSSWRPNGKVDELQHWTEQTRQQSRFNAVPTCCRVSHIISQIFYGVLHWISRETVIVSDYILFSTDWANNTKSREVPIQTPSPVLSLHSNSLPTELQKTCVWTKPSSLFMYSPFGSSFVLTFLFTMWPSVTLLFVYEFLNMVYASFSISFLPQMIIVVLCSQPREISPDLTTLTPTTLM